MWRKARSTADRTVRDSSVVFLGRDGSVATPSWPTPSPRRGERTLALVAPLSDADVEAAHTAIMSPLVWDLAHIAAYEDLWLVHRHGGEPLSHPELAAMYDAFETPRAVRGDLPLLDRAQAMEYLADVRERALASSSARRRRRSTSSCCATSTSTARRCCRRSSSRGCTARRARPRAARPRRAGGHTGLERVDVPGRRRARIGAVPAVRLRQRAPAPPDRRAARSASAARRSPTRRT